MLEILISWVYQAETAFDRIVGAIEDIVIDDRFQDLQTDLLEKHFHHFDVSCYYKEMKTCHHRYLNSNKFSSSSELRGEQVDIH